MTPKDIKRRIMDEFDEWYLRVVDIHGVHPNPFAIRSPVLMKVLDIAIKHAFKEKEKEKDEFDLKVKKDFDELYEELKEKKIRCVLCMKSTSLIGVGFRNIQFCKDCFPTWMEWRKYEEGEIRVDERTKTAEEIVKMLDTLEFVNVDGNTARELIKREIKQLYLKEVR